MKRLLSLVAFFATIQASAQQVNPVPDYVFRNQMSVGRNAVTDTAAYFSIGPRYGANKGFMPPIVGDTATFSSGKRNGLLIFSVQKNKFLYWDSVRVQWSDMAGSSGSYIVAGDTSAMLAPYLRKVDTTSMLTAYLRKADTLTLSNRINLKLNATDTASLSNRINLKLNISDTASMLSPYYRSAAATAALATKLNISDTSTMLSPYLRKVDTTAMLSPYYRSATASAALALKLNISDTSTMLGNYVRHAGYGLTKSGQSFLVDTAAMATRARVQKGIDSVAALVGSGTIGGSGTTNYVPKFTASTTIGNSQIFDDNTNLGIGITSSMSAKLHIKEDRSDLFVVENPNTSATNAFAYLGVKTYDGTSVSNGAILGATSNSWSLSGFLGGYNNSAFLATVRANGLALISADANASMKFYTGGEAQSNERLRIFANGRIGVNTTTDAGYQLDINGTLRSVNGANFATTSGNVGIGTASPGYKLDVAHPSSGEIIRGSYTGGTKSPFLAFQANDESLMFLGSGNSDNTSQMGFKVNGSEAGRFNAAREFLLRPAGGDYGDYKLQVDGNIYNTGSAVLAATSGNVGIGLTNPQRVLHIKTADGTASQIQIGQTNQRDYYIGIPASQTYFDFFDASAGASRGRINSAGEWIIDASGTDAGDYKLQVVGNARVGTGKLDIASNTTFGLGVARSGTSEVAGQIYNSNGILYLGAESSAGGQIFTGSSAYAAVIGSGANYPLQFATNNATRATINTNGELLINTTTDNGDFKLQVNGNALISGSIKTANGGSSTAVPWHLGSVVATSVQLDTSNYVEVEINGVYYRLAIVTPL